MLLVFFNCSYPWGGLSGLSGLILSICKKTFVAFDFYFFDYFTKKSLKVFVILDSWVKFLVFLKLVTCYSEIYMEVLKFTQHTYLNLIRILFHAVLLCVCMCVVCVCVLGGLIGGAFFRSRSYKSGS